MATEANRANGMEGRASDRAKASGAAPRETVARFARRVESQLRDLRRKERLRAAMRKRPRGKGE